MNPHKHGWPAECLSDLGKLNVDHFYNADDWEVTHCVTDQWAVDDWLDEAGRSAVIEVSTLIEGPKAFAVQVPLEYDEDGEPSDWETRYFPTPEAARAALSKAKAPAEGEV